MKYKKIILAIILVIAFQVIPVTVSGDVGIPCAKGTANMCGFNDVFVLINNLIKFFLTTVLLPLMIIMISYAGWLFMTSGSNPGKRSQAKEIFKKMGIGLALILFAWSIVYLVFRAFGVDTTRGRAGLSDKTINWAPSNVSAQLNTGSNTTGSNTNSNTSNTKVVPYEASLVPNVVNPAASRMTVTITPKAEYKMGIRVSCAAGDGETIVTGDGTIATKSTTTTVNLKLVEDTDYRCFVENEDGTIKLTDPTDAEIKTRRISPPSNEFKIVNHKFVNDSFVVNYQNSSNLVYGVGWLSCSDAINGQTILGQTGGILDTAPGSGIKTITYNFSPGFSNSLKENLSMKCNFVVNVKDGANVNPGKTITTVLNSTIPANPNQNTINTVFRFDEINTRENSVVLVFNGSINVDPLLNLTCSSLGANHIFRARVTYDSTNNLRIPGTDNNQVAKDTVKSPISVPVVWNGYGLRPGVNYNCTLVGQTAEKVSGYPDQPIERLETSAYVLTPQIPLIKQPESKLDYHVSIRQPRVMYVNYPVLRSINPMANGPYIAQSPFRQIVPDSIFVPVVNGEVVDNSRMNISCTNILGAAMGTSWVRTVSVSGSNSTTNGMSQVYGDNTTGISYGTGFAIPITRDARSGFMHSSAYVCLAGFTVERVPNIRQFFVTVPINIDPTELGPIVLAAENVGANKDYAFFTVVASPRVENNVNYSCRNVNGNYSGEVFWPPHALGTRMPVTIPISSTIPGLKPGLTYNCNLEGVTFQKERLNYQFVIKTP